MSDKKTAIITGASQGIGAGLVAAFLKEGYSVVATSRNVSQWLTASPSLVLIDGDIGKRETAAKTVEAAIKHFGTIDVPEKQKDPIQFTFLWLDEDRWEGKDYKVNVREQEATAHRSVDHRRRKNSQGKRPATVG